MEKHQIRFTLSMQRMFVQLIIHFNADCCIIFRTESFWCSISIRSTNKHIETILSFHDDVIAGVFAFLFDLSFRMKVCFCVIALCRKCARIYFQRITMTNPISQQIRSACSLFFLACSNWDPFTRMWGNVLDLCNMTNSASRFEREMGIRTWA